MLRTHSELGYKQEQRFHLELGLLKMAHAQRLLPIEQLLSDVTASQASPATPKPLARPTIVAGPSGTGNQKAETQRPNFVSPFAPDSARKGTPRQEASLDSKPPIAPRIFGGASVSSTPVVMGAAAPDTLASNNLPEELPKPIADRKEVANTVAATAT